MNNDVLGDICIASRTQSKCDEIIDSVRRKKNIKDRAGKLYSRQINALDIPATVRLIKETNSDIVLNLGSAFVNMSVLEACLATGAAYMDTAIHEEPDKVCEDPPWYANYEWKRKDRCTESGPDAPSSASGSIRAWSTPTARWRSSAISTRLTRLTSWTSTPAATANISPRTSIPRSTSASSSRSGPGLTASGRNIPRTRSSAFTISPSSASGRST